jgi:hypothetical protein
MKIIIATDDNMAIGEINLVKYDLSVPYQARLMANEISGIIGTYEYRRDNPDWNKVYEQWDISETLNAMFDRMRENR